MYETTSIIYTGQKYTVVVRMLFREHFTRSSKDITCAAYTSGVQVVFGQKS